MRSRGRSGVPQRGGAPDREDLRGEAPAVRHRRGAEGLLRPVRRGEGLLRPEAPRCGRGAAHPPRLRLRGVPGIIFFLPVG